MSIGQKPPTSSVLDLQILPYWKHNIPLNDPPLQTMHFCDYDYVSLAMIPIFYRKWQKVGLLVGSLALLSYLLYPRNYQASTLKKEVIKQFWQLPTGSRIAFLNVPSSTLIKQPYPIVYLHGGPGAAIFPQTVEALAPLSALGFHLLFYDQLGSGLSSRLSDINGYTVRRHVEDLHAIVNQLGTRKVILMGQSWGAVLASAFIATYPHQVHQLILTSPGPMYPINKQAINISAPDSISIKKPNYSNQEALEATTNLRMKFATWLGTHLGFKLLSDSEADAFADVVASKSYLSTLCDTSIKIIGRTGNGFYSGLMTYQSLQKQEDFRPKLRGLKTPVLVMKGQCDNQPWGATQEYLDLFPNHHFAFIPNAGHAIQIEQPERYLDTICRFLMKGTKRNFK